MVMIDTRKILEKYRWLLRHMYSVFSKVTTQHWKRDMEKGERMVIYRLRVTALLKKIVFTVMDKNGQK